MQQGIREMGRQNNMQQRAAGGIEPGRCGRGRASAYGIAAISTELHHTSQDIFFRQNGAAT